MRGTSTLAALSAGFSCLLATAAPVPLAQERMRETAGAFYRIGLDPEQVYRITTARLQRDRLTVELESGTLVLARPLLGRITGACYSGRADLLLVPPTSAERTSLENGFGHPVFEAEASHLYLRFYDYTPSELTSGLEPVQDPAAHKRCSKIFSERNGAVRLYEENTIRIPFNLELDFLEEVLSPAMRNDFFLLEAELEEKGWITYLQRTRREPQVALLRIRSPGHFGNLFDPEPWTFYPLSGPRTASLQEVPSIDILHNEMKVVIPDRSHFTIDSLITWKATVDIASARLSLVNSLGGTTWDDDQAKRVLIHSVTAEDGTPLPFVHWRHELLVKLPARVPAGETARLRVEADEKTIFQITPESYWVLNTYPWFPQEAVYLGGVYTFDWTVEVRRPMLAAGSGTTVRTWVDKKRKLNGAQWRSDTPFSFPSLLFGNYRVTEGYHKRRGDGRMVNIKLHWMPSVTLEHEFQTSTYIIYNPFMPPLKSAGPKTFTYMVPMSKPRELVDEVIRIIDYFEQVLGPYPNDEIDLAQMGPYMWFGQAPPGLVQITGEYFLSQGLISSAYQHPGAMDFLRKVLPHEIAHHYWGDVVLWRSPADQWLSESLAEYSAAMFMQAADGEKTFRQILKQWRVECERWEGTVPVAHARRASGETRWNVRRALLYNKGPLVVHMLRTLVGDEDFVRILQNLLTRHRGGSITTGDFQVATEEIIGARMDWFFDQWIRGTGILELRFSYEIRPRNGKFLFEARLVQADAAHPKALFVPLNLEFAGGRFSRRQWLVTDADESLKLTLPEKPVKVTLDEAGDLLARIQYR